MAPGEALPGPESASDFSCQRTMLCVSDVPSPPPPSMAKPDPCSPLLMQPDPDPPVDAARSRLMSSIAQQGSKPEMRVRRALHAAGLRFRLHRRGLPGTPDIVFPSRRAVVFVHGCFWHRHPGCSAASTPKTRYAFWQEKFDANVARDRRVSAELRAEGWAVHVVWECETRNEAFLPALQAFLSLHLPQRRRRGLPGHWLAVTPARRR